MAAHEVAAGIAGIVADGSFPAGVGGLNEIFLKISQGGLKKFCTREKKPRPEIFFTGAESHESQRRT